MDRDKELEEEGTSRSSAAQGGLPLQLKETLRLVVGLASSATLPEDAPLHREALWILLVGVHTTADLQDRDQGIDFVQLGHLCGPVSL